MNTKNIIYLLLLLFLFIGGFANAQISNDNNNLQLTTGLQGINKSDLQCMTTTHTAIINGILSLLTRFIILPVLLVSIILIIKNRNNKEKQKSNKKLFYITIVLLLIVFAFSLITAVIANRSFESMGCPNRVSLWF